MIITTIIIIILTTGEPEKKKLVKQGPELQEVPKRFTSRRGTDVTVKPKRQIGDGSIEECERSLSVD